MESTSILKTKAIVANIRRIRERKHCLQVYIGGKLGISQNAYCKLELGYSNITLAQLIKIAEVLEIDLAELVQPDAEEKVQLKVVTEFTEAGEESFV